jgi:hypothetical protein
VLLERTSWPDVLRFGPDLLTQQQANLELVFYGDGIGGFTTVEKETTSIGTVEYALSLKIAPMNAHAQKYMGMVKLQQGNLEQAVFHLSKIFTHQVSTYWYKYDGVSMITSKPIISNFPGFET